MDGCADAMNTTHVWFVGLVVVIVAGAADFGWVGVTLAIGAYWLGSVFTAHAIGERSARWPALKKDMRG